MIKLYDYYRSSAGYRVRLALNLKELSYEREVIHLLNRDHKNEDYKKINPAGLVPALIDKDVVLTQSLAICEYLEAVYPNVSLLTSDHIINAHIRAVMQTIACDIHPLNNLRVLEYLKHRFNVDDKAKMEWYFHWLTLGFESILEIKLHFEAQMGKKFDFLFSDRPTFADICLIPQIYNAKRFEFSMKEFGVLNNIYQNANTLEPFIRAQPENQIENI